MTSVAPPRHPSFVARRALALAGITGTAAFSVFAVSAPAAAALPTCADFVTGSIEVATDVCSLTVTTSGTVVIPASVSTLEALLVGGGGAGFDYREGFGGQVVFVNGIAGGQTLNVFVGEGGTYAAGSSDETATELYDEGFTWIAGAGPEVGNGEAGVLPSARAASVSATNLFPATPGEVPLAGDAQIPSDPFADLSGTTSLTPAGGGAGGTFIDGRPNSGAGGFQTQTVPSTIPGGSGADGVVILRFAADVTPSAVVATPPGLAATGTEAAPLIAGGVALLGLGAAALVTARRRAVLR